MHNVRKFVRIQKFRDHYRIPAVSEHSDFHCRDIAILCECFELRAQLRARGVMDRFHALRVLHGERGDRCNVVVEFVGLGALAEIDFIGDLEIEGQDVWRVFGL